MNKMFLLFSHTLTKNQKDDAMKSFGIEEFIYLPKDLQELFSNVPNDLKKLSEYLTPIKLFLKQYSKEGDFVLIQGDFGATYILVNFAKSLYLNPVYSTTKRVTQEFEEDGKIIKKSIFEHERFREYE
ncbi:CRISPR-associated protein Csx20 [Aliarcobacter skirrowii]|uniref:CRISPR-associated protein Csx20 n=1 Tax=Aliarcobacter skirrowii TaxID=28200 RepID=UPI0029A0D159|nr:CRISPR-associated protein Csx20 [Aliarcobacter skirrowii]MDX4038019.1 CRISPR-associated protein Csx20 [Aliarcobacter skirrowii]